MAGKSDGSIIIDSKIDTSGFTQGEVNIKSSFGKIASAAGKMGAAIKSAFTVKSKGADGLEEKSEEVKISVDDTAKSVEDGMKKINEAMSSGVSSDGIEKLKKQIEEDTKALEKLIATQKEFIDVGGSKTSAKYLEYEKDINKLRESIEAAQSQLHQYDEEIAQSAQNASQAVSSEADSARQAAENMYGLAEGKQKATQANRELGQAAEDTAGYIDSETRYVSLLQSVLNALKGAAHAPISILKLLGKTILNIPHWTLNLVVSGLKKIGNVGKSAAKIIGKSLFNGLKKLGTVMLGLNKHTKSTGNGFKNILKYGLGIRSLYVLVNKIRNAIKEGLQNLAQYSDETNASLSALKSSATQLKNSLATAFAPLITVAAPALTQFIKLVSQAVTYAGMLIAALTGAKSFTKAVEVQEDYADSLNGTAKAAQKAQKYLSGLDEIRTFTEDSDSSGGVGGLDPSQMFEESEIPNLIGDLAQKLKKACENADFTEIGTIVGAKLRDALDGIPWASIKSTCNKIAHSLATFINGFVATPGLWEIVGVTIGEAINTATGMWNTFFDVTNFIAIGGAIATALNNALQTIDAQELGKALSQKLRALIEAAYGFVTTFDWSGFGAWIGQAINGFFANIDFGLAAQTLSQGIIGALNGLTATIQEVDWYGLGQKVKDFLVNIDWTGVCDAMFEAIGAALGGLTAFLGGLIADAVVGVVEYFRNETEEAGGNIVIGLLKGILKANQNIKEWINEHIFRPFIDGFKSIFGIHSPSTVMAEMGTFLIQGLLNGIVSLISSVKAKFEEIKNIISTKFTETKQKIVETWNNTKTNLSTIWNSIKTAGSNFGTNLKNSILNSWNSIKTNASTIWSGIKNTITSAYSSISNIIGNLASSFSGAIDKAKNAAANIISAFSNIHIPLPHFSIGSTSHSIAGVSFSLPSISVDWYAKGGLFDQPTVIGVGEAGQEAVLPLTNSKVMSLLASNIVAKMPTPYLASGAVVPPKAQSSSVQVNDSATKNMESMYDMMASVFDKISQNQGIGTGGTIRIPISINGRQILEAVVDAAKLQQTVSGSNPLALGR